MNLWKWSQNMGWKTKAGEVRHDSRFLPSNDATFSFRPVVGRIGVIAVALAIFSLADTPGLSQIKKGPIATLSTVYAADPDSPWFLSWIEERRQIEGALFHPKIQISAGHALLEKVLSDGSSIGLLSKSELQTVIPPVDSINIATSGFQACAMIAVRDEASTREVGDLALLPKSAQIAATSDTLEIARALLGAHHLDEFLSVSQTSVSNAVEGLSSGRLAFAVLPIELDNQAQFASQAEQFRYIEITDAAATATAGQKFAVRSYSPSRLLGLPLTSSVNTVCDDIMIVSSAQGQFPPERFERQIKTPVAQTDGSYGLFDRTKTALEELMGVIIAKYEGFGQ
jgi:hypothetical protein